MKVALRSGLLATEEIESVNRCLSMQAEADEHYQLLVDLQKIDPEFDAWLRLIYDRKREVESTLLTS